MCPGTYILDGNGKPLAVDVLEWAKISETADRKVAVNVIGTLRVSTVFLAIDHNWSSKGLPVLWETMVFGLPDNEEIMERYTSKAGALEGHKRICGEMRARASLGKGGRLWVWAWAVIALLSLIVGIWMEEQG